MHVRPVWIVGAATLAIAVGAGAVIVTTSSSNPSRAPATTTGSATGVSAVPTAKVDDDHDGLDDNLEMSLAQKYAPVVFFDAQELSYPVSVPWLLARMGLQHREDGCTPDHRSVLSSASGAIGSKLLGPTQGRYWTFPNDFTGVGPRLFCQDDKRTSLSTAESVPDGASGDGVGDEQNMQLYFLDGTNNATTAGDLNGSWVTYVHVYPSRQAGIIIQYWHPFGYNPANLDTHEGDWDASLQVELDAHLNLVGAWFSRHNNDSPGRFIPASSLSFYNGTHIEEAVDSGGHGAYASPMDWCLNPDTVSVAGAYEHLSISWPDSTASPTAATLDHQNCSMVGLGHLGTPWSHTGGTVWFTWKGPSGGEVQQAGTDLAQRLNMSYATGSSLVNIGECNPGHQASKLNEDTCYPLKGGAFIQYSGQWGTSRQGATSPRGPVFQGFNQDLGQYESWYNDGADTPYRGTPASTTGSPGAPADVTVNPANGSAVVNWRPPAASLRVTGYRVDVSSFATDRPTAAPASALSQTVGANTHSATFGNLVEDCHQQYTARVTALTSGGADDGSASSAPFRPSGIVTPGTAPPYVVILLDGISESKPGFAMDPYNPTLTGPASYCPENVDPNGNVVENGFNRAPTGPADFFSKWNYFDPTDTRSGNDPFKQSNSTPRDLTAGDQTHQFMLDAIAATGAVILPYSYSSPGASLRQNGGKVTFTFPAYTVCNSSPGLTGLLGCDADPGGQPDPTNLASKSFSIKDDTQSLDNEIHSIQSTWSNVPIVVLGHSQGGLIAFTAWSTRLSQDQSLKFFSLDSPINGVCPKRITSQCLGPADINYPPYDARDELDSAYLASDNRAGDPFRFIGTWGDSVQVSIPLLGGPAYGTGDETLQHQLLVSGAKCVDAMDNSDCPDQPTGPDHISECRVPDSGWVNDDQHFITKFCPGNVDYFNRALGFNTIYRLVPPSSTTCPAPCGGEDLQGGIVSAHTRITHMINSIYHGRAIAVTVTIENPTSHTIRADIFDDSSIQAGALDGGSIPFANNYGFNHSPGASGPVTTADGRECYGDFGGGLQNDWLSIQPGATVTFPQDLCLQLSYLEPYHVHSITVDSVVIPLTGL